MADRRFTPAEIKDIQRTCNAFTGHWLENVTPLRVDGKWGPATKSRIMACKFYIGYGKNRDASWHSATVRRLRHPNDTKYSTKALIETGQKRRRRQRQHEKANNVLAWLTPGVTTWEGKTVAKCAVPYLNYARANGWRGGVNSGWRDPLYSRHLCIVMCGAPSCPGKCAGTSSNHVGNYCGRFAIDVSDYFTFARLMRQMPNPPNGRRIFNALGAQDPVHFSPSGN